jgi:hypothetical protein
MLQYSAQDIKPGRQRAYAAVDNPTLLDNLFHSASGLACASISSNRLQSSAACQQARRPSKHLEYDLKYRVEGETGQNTGWEVDSPFRQQFSTVAIVNSKSRDGRSSTFLKNNNNFHCPIGGGSWRIESDQQNT